MVNHYLSQFLRNVERPAFRPLLALLVVEAEVVVDEVDLQAQTTRQTDIYTPIYL